MQRPGVGVEAGSGDGGVCAQLLEEHGELPCDFQTLEEQGRHSLQFN